MLIVQEFLETNICKAGETVRRMTEDEWEIQKWTARTYKTIGNVLVASEFDAIPSDEVRKLGLKPNSKRKSLPLTDSATQEALMKGWLIKQGCLSLKIRLSFEQTRKFKLSCLFECRCTVSQIRMPTLRQSIPITQSKRVDGIFLKKLLLSLYPFYVCSSI